MYISNDINIGYKVEKNELEWWHMKLGKIKCHTDGSKINYKVKSAFSIFNEHNQEIYYRDIGLNDESTIFMTEVTVINEAIDYYNIFI